MPIYAGKHKELGRVVVKTNNVSRVFLHGACPRHIKNIIHVLSV
jgi:hypothetical protein